MGKISHIDIISEFSKVYKQLGLPLWYSGQGSLEVRVRFWRYQIFWEVMGLERAPLSLESTIEELLGRKK
jgi:hypothetical protein